MKAVTYHKWPCLLTNMVVLVVSFTCSVVRAINGDYLIGVGSYDMTGPAALVNMMGYANFQQSTSGVHFRLRARAFVVAESSQGPRFAFVNLDAGMASQLVTIKALERLKLRYGDLYNKQNVAISGIHTHAGPGGYLQYLLYSVTSLGFVKQSFDVIVTAIVESIAQAHKTMKPGSVFINKGDLEDAGINRSPSSYLLNPPQERARYPSNVDTLMTLLKFVDTQSGKNVGAFSWLATHGTSMSKANKLISGDNKGAAARFLEDWFSGSTTKSHPKSYASPSRNTKLEFGEKFKATGGEECTSTASQDFKVRKNDGSRFVGAFCQSNAGDVSPNVQGAFCTDTGLSCDFNRSSCHGDDQLCVGRGPGYPDEILSTKIIGQRQFKKARDLINSANQKLTGKIDYRQVYLNFTDLEVVLDGNNTVRTCPAALGPGFAAGTTDGPGVLGFQQGDTEINEFWQRARDLLKKPTQYQVDCQKPKAILLDAGEMFAPYAWAPAILPIQMLRLGQLIILSVPGEFTTMAGRRLREAVKDTLVSEGNGEFNNDTQIVIAGLTNTYSQYVTTFEEYQRQRYEGASTLYGPHTLSAYIQEFKKLAKAMATGQQIVDKGPQPPDLSSILISLLADPIGDVLPHVIKFGDVKDDILLSGSLRKGDRVSATFWSANPRNDLLTEGTFAGVEIYQRNAWVPVYDDDDLCLYFKWSLDHSGKYDLATIEWEVPKDAKSGIYRLTHFGSWKDKRIFTNNYFTGTSSSFTVS